MSPSASLAGMPCLVLGAGGFIGLNLCRALLAAGADARGYGRRPAFAEAPPPLPWTAAEFDDTASLREALAGVRVVFHLLGGSIPATAEHDPVADLRGNAAASLALFGLCRQAGVRRIVFVSSGGTVYGVPRRLPVAEDHPTDPVSVYGIHKLLVEKHLGLLSHRHGVQGVVLRAGNPYGPHQRPGRGQGLVATLIARRLAGQPLEIWGDGHTVRDYLHVDDLVRALLAGATYQGTRPVLNIGSGTGRSVLEVAAGIDAVLGLRGAPVLHHPARAADVPANVLDVTLARQELGWTPQVEWRDGLRGTIAWLRQALARNLPAEAPSPP